jgi:hypothetical protein
MAFTNVEPYKTWGKYLRIVRLAAYSAESGTTAHESSGTYTVKNTKYGSMYDNYSTSAYAGLYNASTSEAGGTSDKVFNYALAQLKYAGINVTKNYTVCILENVAHYSGTVQYYIGAKRTLGCVCLSPGSFGTQTGFENVMVHEIGGHAIGHLADLYTTVSGTIPADRIDGTKEMQAIGWYQNVSVYNDQGLCPWSSFFKSAEYSTYYPNVNLYEGARSYTKGILLNNASLSFFSLLSYLYIYRVLLCVYSIQYKTKCSFVCLFLIQQYIILDSFIIFSYF